MAKTTDVPCLFCGELHKGACGQVKPIKVPREPKRRPVTDVPIPDEPKVPVPVSQRRVSALDRMRAGSARPAGTGTRPVSSDAQPSRPAVQDDPDQPTPTPVGDPGASITDDSSAVFAVAIANLQPILHQDHKGGNSVARRTVKWRSEHARKTS